MEKGHRGGKASPTLCNKPRRSEYKKKSNESEGGGNNSNRSRSAVGERSPFHPHSFFSRRTGTERNRGGKRGIRLFDRTRQRGVLNPPTEEGKLEKKLQEVSPSRKS